ncbi:hypothetical protein Tco_1160295, partial [Tanacetum coccineum]
EVVHKELGDSLVRSTTTASSLEVECKETIGDIIAQTRFENVSKLSNDSLLLIESSGDKEILGEDASKQRRINAIDADEDITLVNVQDDADKEMYDVALKSVKPKVKGDVIEDLNVPVNVVSTLIKVSAATTTTATIPTPRKGIVITELGTPTITRSSQQPSQAEVQDKGKGKMIKPKPVKKMSKKDQFRSDEEEAKRLQAEFDKNERLIIEKDEANVSLTK